MAYQDDRREYPRIKAAIPITLDSEIIGKSSDISETGLGFISEKPILSSSPKVKIEFYPTNYIEATLNILWSNRLSNIDKFKYGAIFTSLNQEDIKCLRKFTIEATIKPFLDTLKDDENKSSIYNFFSNNIKDYITKIIEISKLIKYDEISNDKAKDEFFKYTDKVLDEAGTLEQKLQQKIIIKKIKEFFRTLVSHWIYKGKIVERAFKKPRGYPGDYYTLEQIYDNKSNSTGIGYCSDLYFLANEYAVAVRNRKEKIKELLINFINKTDLPILKILNIACGSCREIREIFANRRCSLEKKLLFNLLDQDEEALEYVRNTIPQYKNLKLDFIKEDVLNLNKKNLYKDKLKDQNLIYSIGLCDYLPDRILKQIIEFSLDILTKDGYLILAHKDIKRYRPAAPNWFCDWKFYPRTEKEFIKLILSVNDRDISVENVTRESSGRIVFITLLKK